VPTTTSSARAALPAALVVLAAACVLLTGAVTLAGPAAAIEDPRRPRVEITHGPSCGPGVVRVAVVNGTAEHRVALVFDGGAEQDSAVLGGGEQVELVSSDVDWGRTVDVAVTVTGADGTAELPFEFGTYTRPSAQDCAAVGSPAPRPDGASTPGATPVVSVEGRDVAGGPAGTASSAAVSPGGVVTVRATGFAPGEPVTVSLVGVDDPLATVAAAADGSAAAVVQIPRQAALGTASVQLVGGLSATTAGLDLQVAARARPIAERTTPVPGLAAGIALVGASGMLGLTAARRPHAGRVAMPR
jgi:hypothetical protein